MLTAWITLAHFSVSSAMSIPSSAGEPASTAPPNSTSCALILVSARPALISLLSFSMISAAVLGSADAIPRAGLVASDEFGHRRHVRQLFCAPRGRHCQSAKFARSDGLNRSSHRAKHHLHLSAQ